MVSTINVRMMSFVGQFETPTTLQQKAAHAEPVNHIYGM